MNAFTIKSFSILQLHGYKDFKIPFSENTAMLLGKNGAGKTTALTMLYYFLSLQ